MIEKEKLIGFSRHEYAPMIRPQSEKLLVELITSQNPKRVLEIGTFLGYSAALMLQNCECDLITIEKDAQNAEDAVKNLEKFGFSGRFEVKNMDALDFLLKNQDEKFDFIFLDGPKGQYIKFLPYLKKMLNLGGLLVCDDVLFYGLVDSDEKVEHKHRTIVNNLRTFLENLKADLDFETKLFEFEDGLSVSKKIK